MTLTDAERAFLLTWRDVNPFDGRAALRAAWQVHRAELLAEAAAAHPPTWPEALFELEGPLPTRRSIFGAHGRTVTRTAQQDLARLEWLRDDGLLEAIHASLPPKAQETS